MPVFNKTSMTTKSFDRLRTQRTKSASRRLSCEERRRQILKVAEKQFAATGLGSTTTVTLAEAAGVSEPILYIHFETKQKPFEEAVEFNTQVRLTQSLPTAICLPPQVFLEARLFLQEPTSLIRQTPANRLQIPHPRLLAGTSEV